MEEDTPIRKVEELKVHEDHPRKTKADSEDFDDFVSSVADEGVLQPLLINSKGQVIAGRRRLEAAEEAGLEEVPVHEVTVEDYPATAIMGLVENLHREDLNPMDKIEAVEELSNHLESSIDTDSSTPGPVGVQKRIAELLNVSENSVSIWLTIAREATPEQKEKLREGELTQTELHNRVKNRHSHLQPPEGGGEERKGDGGYSTSAFERARNGISRLPSPEELSDIDDEERESLHEQVEAKVVPVLEQLDYEVTKR